MMINGGVKRIAHTYPYWAAALIGVTGVKKKAQKAKTRPETELKIL